VHRALKGRRGGGCAAQLVEAAQVKEAERAHRDTRKAQRRADAFVALLRSSRSVSPTMAWTEVRVLLAKRTAFRDVATEEERERLYVAWATRRAGSTSVAAGGDSGGGDGGSPSPARSRSRSASRSRSRSASPDRDGSGSSKRHVRSVSVGPTCGTGGAVEG
jgi:hypothetical protein